MNLLSVLFNHLIVADQVKLFRLWNLDLLFSFSYIKDFETRFNVSLSPSIIIYPTLSTTDSISQNFFSCTAYLLQFNFLGVLCSGEARLNTSLQQSINAPNACSYRWC